MSLRILFMFVTLILGKWEWVHTLLALTLAAASKGVLLRASARTKSVPGLCSLLRVVELSVVNCLTFLMHVYWIESRPTLVESALWIVKIVKFVRYHKVARGCGGAVTRLTASSLFMWCLTTPNFRLYSLL